MEKKESWESIPLRKKKISQNEKNKADEDDLRRRLNFFYSNPCQRWKMRDRSHYDRIPLKLIVQILKIIFVTTQAILVGYERSNIAVHIEQSTLAMKSIFLQNFTPHEAEVPVTSEKPDLSIFTTATMFKLINHAVQQFEDVQSMAFGSFYYSYDDNGAVSPMHFCMKYYKSRKFIPQNNTLYLDPKEESDCFDTFIENNTSEKITKKNKKQYSIEHELSSRNMSHHLDNLLEIKLLFTLKNVRLGTLYGSPNVQCFKYHNSIMFDNSKRSGKVFVFLRSVVSELHCSQGNFPTHWTKDARIISIASITGILNSMSLVFCSGSIKNSAKLMLATKKYFKRHLGVDLPWSEKFSFIKLWDALIIINDILTICGTALIVYSEYWVQMDISVIYGAATSLIGTGVLLVWLGILRYFAYFPTFYLLFLILRRAIVAVMRYLICVAILYVGFVFCGWLVLGPYHNKFRTWESASECLFAVMNGDEVFETFAAVTSTAGYIWWFSRIYLYVYIALFTTIALNLVIAIFLDCYDTIKDYVKNGFPKTLVFEFIEQKCTADTDSQQGYPYFCMRALSQNLSENRESVKISLGNSSSV